LEKFQELSITNGKVIACVFGKERHFASVK